MVNIKVVGYARRWDFPGTKEENDFGRLVCEADVVKKCGMVEGLRPVGQSSEVVGHPHSWEVEQICSGTFPRARMFVGKGRPSNGSDWPNSTVVEWFIPQDSCGGTVFLHRASDGVEDVFVLTRSPCQKDDLRVATGGQWHGNEDILVHVGRVQS